MVNKGHVNLFYKTQVYLGSDLWVRVSKRPFADLTDVTLAEEDTNSNIARGTVDPGYRV